MVAVALTLTAMNWQLTKKFMANFDAKCDSDFDVMVSLFIFVFVIAVAAVN